MELNNEQVALITQICELSTRMGLPASANNIVNGVTPKGAVLEIKTEGSEIYITKDQLAVAKLTLRIIYEANTEYFSQVHSNTRFNAKFEGSLKDDSAPKTFTVNNVIDAINLGANAATAHIRVCGVYDHVTNKGYLLIQPMSSTGGSSERIPFKYIGLMSSILEMYNWVNNDFKPQQD